MLIELNSPVVLFSVLSNDIAQFTFSPNLCLDLVNDLFELIARLPNLKLAFIQCVTPRSEHISCPVSNKALPHIYLVTGGFQQFFGPGGRICGMTLASLLLQVRVSSFLVADV